MRLTQTKAELRAAAAIRPRAVVMTMGALHDGHAALLAEARERVGPDGSVVLTIFVNPLQFGPSEDFERYPRTLASDLAIAKNEGVDLVFNPSRDELYPNEPSITVHPGPLADELEGVFRPGHFSGVLTVVSKLLHVDPSFVTTQSKLLEQKELLRRAPSPADARVVRLSLTDKTRKHLAGLAEQHKAFKKTVFEEFSEPELAEFTAKLATLTNRLEKACLIAAMDFET